MEKYYEPIEHETQHPVTVLVPDDENLAYSPNWLKLFSNQTLSFSVDQWVDDDSLDSVIGLDLLRSFSGNLIVSRKFHSVFENCDLSFSPARLTSKNPFIESRIKEMGDYFVVMVEREVKIINENMKPMQFWPSLKRFKSEGFVIDQRIPFGCKVVRDVGCNNMIIVNEEFASLASDNKLVMGFREYPVVPGVFLR